MIYQFKSNGYNIVLDVESGSIHVVDELAYDAIDALNRIGVFKPEVLELVANIGATSAEKERILKEEVAKVLKVHLAHLYSEVQFQEVAEEIVDLVEEGQLFSPLIMEEEIQNHTPVVKALCLHIAHDCNLACKYCFAKEGEYHGKREWMSLDTGKKALDFLVAHSGNRRNLEVDFFGGEPLMNWQVVKGIVAYGREQEQKTGKNFRFTLTTNGVLLDDERIDFANGEMENVVLSLDGRREINDKMRPTRNGKGSYDVVVPKFQKFVKERGDKEYFIRGTFTRENLDFVEDVKHFAKLGFKQISIEPVVLEEENELAIREVDLQEIYNQYDELAKEMVKNQGSKEEFTFFHFLLDLEGGPCVAKRVSGCGAGSEYLAVTPTGDLYPCHQFVGQEKFLLGNVDEGIVKPEIVEAFSQCSVYSKEECKECFAKYYCSGGCMANSYQFHRDINKIYEIGCKMEKKRVECAIMLKVAIG